MLIYYQRYIEIGGRRAYQELLEDGVSIPSIESVKEYMANKSVVQKLGKQVVSEMENVTDVEKEQKILVSAEKEFSKDRQTKE